MCSLVRITSNPWSACAGVKCILPMSAVSYPAARRPCATVQTPSLSAIVPGWAGSRRGWTPVSSPTRAGMQVAAALYALANTTPSRARPSIAGVGKKPPDEKPS